MSFRIYKTEIAAKDPPGIQIAGGRKGVGKYRENIKNDGETI